MFIPKSENILKVINNFKKVLPLAKRDEQLNMSVSQVSSVGCGTIHCHGGWYAVAACDTSEFIVFDNGACKMTEDLGFDDPDMYSLTTWANQNPEIWGNNKGAGIFCRANAFEGVNRPAGAKNLQDIIDHWTEVYERVKAIEGKTNDDDWGKTEPPKEKVIIRYVAVDESIKEETKELIFN